MAVGLAQVYVPQPVARQLHRVVEGILFDVHVEGVQHDFDVVAVDLRDEFQRLGAGVEDIALEAVQHLHAQRDVVFRGHVAQGANVGDGPGGVAGLIQRLGVVRRPIGVQPAPEELYARGLHLLEGGLVLVKGRLYDGRVGVRDVVGLVRAVAAGQYDALRLGLVLQSGEVFVAHVQKVVAADLQNVKAQILDLLHIGDVVRPPCLFPVGIVDAVFHGFLPFLP